MKLIFIHGRAQENFDEATLKQEWTEALKKGLDKSGLVLPSHVEIEFPYYGKLLNRLVKEAESVPSTAIVTRNGSNATVITTGESIFFEAFLTEIAEKAATTRKEKAELNEILIKERGILNDERVQKIMSFLDKKKFIGESLLRLITDVYKYLTVPSIKSQINKHIENAFDTVPCVVVGHSLGSIISYLVLKNNPDFHVQKLITVGSPLGLISVRNYLELPLRMPKCVKNGWFNAYDDCDFVALHPLDRHHFNIMPPIENKNDVQNHTNNQHGIIGYLDDAIVAQRIYEALV